MFRPPTLLLLSLLVAGSSRLAPAQIVDKNPGQVKADNRRALREVRRDSAPNKASHLAIDRSRLKRGASEAQPQAAGTTARKPRKGPAPSVKKTSRRSLRRKKKL